ncbi:hypothetical protein SAMN04488542_102256 [Fontibacillus panacisegetis]|uniref:Uncharacterized protein n=1 Tax=Fontibacillus panacisegetis TaxID=670482 RepID=A0A1G7G1U3_9BACL|nr:hypothetical protein [Fontibacillus panacisegetis]SDE82076.1 hypothetical protein SAMN04488542_102256 [Fontibacillus panacisegetis]
MFLGRKIYYQKANGAVIVARNESRGDVRETTIDEDFAMLIDLRNYDRESLGVLTLESGQYAQDFAECNGYRVNPDTLELEFSYLDPSDPEPQEPVYQKPLSLEVDELKRENTLLKAQNTALSDRADFIEDCIAEMAVQVYS